MTTSTLEAPVRVPTAPPRASRPAPSVYGLSRGDSPFRWKSVPVQATPEAERLHRKQRLAASFRLFALYGYDMGGAGHITARDPILTDHFWVNPVGVYFGHIRVSDLLLVNHHGDIVEGAGMLNRAAFAIHSQLHIARPDVVAAAHAHALHGKAFSALGKHLAPITQDSCAFYQNHALFADFSGVVLDTSEGERIAAALGNQKAAILQNHGFLTVGESVEAAVWRFIAMDDAAKAQLLAEAAGSIRPLSHEVASHTAGQVGTEVGSWFSFLPLWDRVLRDQPDFLE
ncbi:Decarboxylase NovR [Andreprevotia sp. IGB-42]|uniref:class II aldolase/adducin family protein n=1 Tax=Andreprevotia sp. IGB-42 TaxID=2497473 RepID=UPI001359BEBA|nr:class II aldolase/adducin family protein [Andreprevotia sp. IGB-42]KAF0812644.1 Decarboxylase NovR [Andreprevotia sp. IGB-42]